MAIIIQDLLRELVSYTRIDSSQSGSYAGSILSKMRKEFESLDAGRESDKQAKMIKLFIGATLWAFIFDDLIFKTKRYPEELARKILKIEGDKWPDSMSMWRQFNSAPSLIKIGEEALLELPQSFNSQIFKEPKTVLHPMPYFLGFNSHPEKIDLLVKFCMENSADLEQATMESEESSSVEPPQKSTSMSCSPSFCTQVFSGFMIVLGVAAFAIAFTVLNAASLGLAGSIVAGVGAVAIVGGFGLFAASKQCKSSFDELEEDSYSF